MARGVVGPPQRTVRKAEGVVERRMSGRPRERRLEDRDGLLVSGSLGQRAAETHEGGQGVGGDRQSPSERRLRLFRRAPVDLCLAELGQGRCVARVELESGGQGRDGGVGVAFGAIEASEVVEPPKLVGSEGRRACIANARSGRVLVELVQHAELSGSRRVARAGVDGSASVGELLPNGWVYVADLDLWDPWQIEARAASRQRQRDAGAESSEDRSRSHLPGLSGAEGGSEKWRSVGRRCQRTAPPCGDRAVRVTGPPRVPRPKKARGSRAEQ